MSEEQTATTRNEFGRLAKKIISLLEWDFCSLQPAYVPADRYASNTSSPSYIPAAASPPAPRSGPGNLQRRPSEELVSGLQSLAINNKK